MLYKLIVLACISTVDLGRAGDDEVSPVKQHTFGVFGVEEQMEFVEKLLDGGEALLKSGYSRLE